MMPNFRQVSTPHLGCARTLLTRRQRSSRHPRDRRKYFATVTKQRTRARGSMGGSRGIELASGDDVMFLGVLPWLRWPTVNHHDFWDVVGRELSVTRQIACAVRGHDFLLHFGDRRMSLKCAACGHETPGWDIGAPRFSLPSVRRCGTVPRLRAAPHVDRRQAA
jgi:hypothetical protein